MIDAEAYVDACFYCGMFADSVDHVIPRWLVGDDTVMVMACRECNCALGAKMFDDAIAKRQWIKWWLRQRYERLLGMPEWSDRELAALGPALRQYVLANLRNREIIKARLAWPRNHF